MRVRRPRRLRPLKPRSLSEEQRTALEHLIAAPRLSVLEGLAGTGKSYLLGAAREAW
jgi:predicted ribonuclease YlaK